MRRRRYEILLPIRFNDGRDIPARRLYDCREELMTMFGGITADGVVRAGSWRDTAGVRYDDETIRLTADIDDTAEALQLIRDYKSRVLERLEQKEIYIVSYPIDVV